MRKTGVLCEIFHFQLVLFAAGIIMSLCKYAGDKISYIKEEECTWRG